MKLKTFRATTILLLLVALTSCKARNSSVLQSSTDCPTSNDWTNAPVDPNDPAKAGAQQQFKVETMTAELATRVFPIVQASYGGLTGGSPYKVPGDLRGDTDFGLIAEKDGKVIVFAGGKNSMHGRKVNIVATDGSTDGSTAVKIMIKNLADGSMPATYAELSGAPLLIASMARDKLKVVPFDRAKQILNPPHVVTKPSDQELQEAVNCREIPNNPLLRQNAYRREIKNVGTHTKVMIGSPTN